MPTDTFLTLNGTRLHLADWGGAGRPILLVHGLASNAKIWNRVAPLLASRYRVVALDQRSHGLSDEAADGNYGFGAVCGDLREVCAQLNFDQPVIVGHSWGGGVALEFAARHPEAAGGVVLIDGGFAGIGQRMTWEETEQRLAPPRLAGMALDDFRAGAERFLGDLYSEEMLDIVLGNFEVRADNTIAPYLKFENHMQIVRAMWEQAAETLYPKVKCPALFLPCVPAEPRDAMAEQFLGWKRESAAALARLMPQARVDWLVDSIHDVPAQRPELVAEKIVGFSG